jgi:hypothetical protein
MFLSIIAQRVLFYRVFHDRSDKGEICYKTMLGQLPEPTTKIVTKAAF